ncbi:DASS family sodium-coupled anion symporter [Hyphobacterium sp. HN65]|uniref:DASS family sodium-coupled anion symporter n=1 Tax=Hyphobacterium lacteum TaxID=3116575 RepID=A0ABU7LPA6_9PROT|nr:DASS family sodium-coupled anion symporter [Hyphobacterium sp. HN65]MEE2525737.1 DASS family sodium-coupled anion symporter [Hyphobacterium sp. HN65]
MRSLAFFVLERRWLFIAFAIGALLYFLPTPEGLSREGELVLIMSVISVILFVTEPVPLPTVALMMIVGQVLLLGKEPDQVAQSLMSDSVLFIMGSLMLAVAIVKQKLDKRIAYFIVRMTGPNIRNIAMGVAIISGLLASVIGEHTVAAMMLPVALTLISLAKKEGQSIRGVAAILLLSISYGCSIAGIGTPSGGARNAIMIGYWREFFFDPLDPESRRFLVSYFRWALFSYPVFLIQLPFLVFILFRVFKPETTDLSRAVVKLRHQIADQGPMRRRDWLTVGIFALTLSSWISLSGHVGLGIVALMGAIAFLVTGLVRWDDMNSGVNWGVVLLYAAAISLGVEMRDSGAAEWVATSVLGLLEPLGIESGMPLWAVVGGMTAVITNTMSNGAAVAVIGPVTLDMAVTAGESPLRLGFITAIASSFAYFTVIATPACMIVYSSGYLKAGDFLRVGSRLIIVSMLVLMLAAMFYWPLLGL